MAPRLTSAAALARLEALRDEKHVPNVQRFFRTAPGEYGEDDQFLGIKVPVLRAVGREFRDLSLPEARKLLASAWHEARMLALIVLVDQYKRGDELQREKVYRLYLANTKRINNWDLVDTSAGYIVGAHLFERSRTPLRALARSKSLWERRIAMIATQYFIRQGDLEPTFALATQLLGDKHDLMHKAVGWMLREAGQKDEAALRRFLTTHAPRMPRTMLRYAIEKLPADDRARFLETKAQTRLSS